MKQNEKYIKVYEDKEVYLTSRFTRSMATSIPSDDTKFYDFVTMVYDFLDTFTEEALMLIGYDELLKSFVAYANKYYQNYEEKE